MKKIVYILSDNRSGSTLLDQLLGAHNQIVSLGEVHHLPAYALQDRSLYNPIHPLVCSCGVRIDECPFWVRVEARLGRSFGSLSLKLRFYRRSEPGAGGKVRRLTYLPPHLLNRKPRILLTRFASLVFDKGRVAVDSFDLFNAIWQETGADFLVDSSKAAFRFRTLYDHEPKKVLGLMLARDYRGTVHSKVKRGHDLQQSARSWTMRMQQMRALTSDIPSSRLIRVRYEDLCRDPRSELGRICDFCEIDFSESLLSRPTTGVHHLGGSPSKFDPARKAIELDQSYLDAFTRHELDVMRNIVGDVATEWGYL